MTRNPYVFIVGCPRSGTTLLKRIVDAHSEIAITPETHWVPRRLREGRGLRPDGTVTEELIDALFAYPRFARLKVTAEELRERLGDGVRYADFVSAIYDLYGRGRDKRFVGDKTPDYVRKLPVLHALWPETRFVHIVRDGRDVCLSAVGWKARAERHAQLFRTWSKDPLVTAALWWQRLVTLGREDGAALGADLYYELRYEAVVADAEAECRRLCAFLGLHYEESMLRFHEGRTRVQPGLSSKRAWLPITAGLRDWRTQMAREDVEAFEAATGDLLDDLGYERAAPRPGPTARARAKRVAALCEPDLPGRRPIPPAAF